MRHSFLYFLSSSASNSKFLYANLSSTCIRVRISSKGSVTAGQTKIIHVPSLRLWFDVHFVPDPFASFSWHNWALWVALKGPRLQKQPITSLTHISAACLSQLSRRQQAILLACGLTYTWPARSWLPICTTFSRILNIRTVSDAELSLLVTLIHLLPLFPVWWSTLVCPVKTDSDPILLPYMW